MCDWNFFYPYVNWMDMQFQRNNHITLPSKILPDALVNWLAYFHFICLICPQPCVQCKCRPVGPSFLAQINSFQLSSPSRGKTSAYMLAYYKPCPKNLTTCTGGTMLWFLQKKKGRNGCRSLNFVNLSFYALVCSGTGGKLF